MSKAHTHSNACEKDSKSRTNPKCIEPNDAYFLVTDARVQNVAKYSQKTFLKSVRRTKFSWAKYLLCWRRWCWLWRRWQRQRHRPQLIKRTNMRAHVHCAAQHSKAQCAILVLREIFMRNLWISSKFCWMESYLHGRLIYEWNCIGATCSNTTINSNIRTAAATTTARNSSCD